MPPTKLKNQTKTCPVCHRPFHNRKKWQSRGIWNAIIYCSDKCRKNRKPASHRKGDFS
ncbi:DUF2256 domain-containing protein [Rubritalea tangerina]|uniref:DUF2256 domain-containing protein n=1 Tax=Rubritalea tangerina TaxID=430798 RepID=A0ABW4ZBH9_9BACT